MSSDKGKTDKNGKASFSCEAAKLNYDANYNVVIKMVDESRREVTGSAKVLITRGAFYLTVTPDKYFYNQLRLVVWKFPIRLYWLLNHYL